MTTHVGIYDFILLHMEPRTRDGVPQKLGNIIFNTYEGNSCRVTHDGKITNTLDVRKGVRLRPSGLL